MIEALWRSLDPCPAWVKAYVVFVLIVGAWAVYRLVRIALDELLA